MTEWWFCRVHVNAEYFLYLYLSISDKNSHFIFVCITQTLHYEQDATQGQFFKWSTTGLTSVFLFQTGCHTKVKEPGLLYYLPIAESEEGEIVGFMPFPRLLVLCEMETVSFRIWTLVTAPISMTITIMLSVTPFLYLIKTHQKQHIITRFLLEQYLSNALT